MTDQEPPSVDPGEIGTVSATAPNQLKRLRCPTCDYPNGPWRCPDPWHGSQDVEGAFASAIRRPGETPEQYGERVKAYQPTTQETEKALETLAEMKHDLAHGMSVQGYREGTMKRLLDEYDAALRSLRTQLADLEEHAEVWRGRANDLEHRRAKDREEIERLKELLERLHGWDMMDVTADGPYWQRTIREALEGDQSR